MYGGKVLAPPCNVLVLAPSATSVRSAIDYRPFDNFTLGRILQIATENAQEGAGVLGELSYPQYDISDAFFFGNSMSKDVAEHLGLVPSAIVDCDVFRTESKAIQDVETALFAFAKLPGKFIYQISRNRAGSRSILPGLLISTEQKLGHPGIEWIPHIEAAYGKAEKATRPSHRLSRFPTGTAAAAGR